MFSEEVQDAAANVTLKEYYDRVTAAKGETEKEQARTALGNVLRNSIKLYVDTGSGRRSWWPMVWMPQTRPREAG